MTTHPFDEIAIEAMAAEMHRLSGMAVPIDVIQAMQRAGWDSLVERRIITEGTKGGIVTDGTIFGSRIVEYPIAIIRLPHTEG